MGEKAINGEQGRTGLQKDRPMEELSDGWEFMHSILSITLQGLDLIV